MENFGIRVQELIDGFENVIDKVSLFFTETNAPVRALGEIISNAPWYVSGAIGFTIVGFTIWILWRAFTK